MRRHTGDSDPQVGFDYGAGITEPDVQEVAAKAGFCGFTRVQPDDPIRSFFVLRAS